MASSFLSDLLDEYGHPGHRFAGHGELRSEHSSARVEWASAQYPDGQVLLACQGDSSAVDVLISGPKSFLGEASDGTKLDCDKYLGELPLLSHIPEGESVLGYPAWPAWETLRQRASLHKLTGSIGTGQ